MRRARRYDLTSFQEGLAVSCSLLGAMAGSLFIAFYGSKLGRRTELQLASVSYGVPLSKKRKELHRAASLRYWGSFDSGCKQLRYSLLRPLYLWCVSHEVQSGETVDVLLHRSRDCICDAWWTLLHCRNSSCISPWTVHLCQGSFDRLWYAQSLTLRHHDGGCL